MKKKTQKKKLLEALAHSSCRELLFRHVDYQRDDRFRELDRRDSYYNGTQYKNRPFTWDGAPINDFGSLNVGGAQPIHGAKPPISQCRPHAQYDLGRVIVNRFTALLCGENRFATFRVPKSAKTEDFLNALADQINLRSYMSEASIIGGKTGSVVIMFRIVKGEFQLECFNSKFVTPGNWLDFHAGEMESFAVTYPYQKEVYDTEKKTWNSEWFIYKRVVTDKIDVTCLPIPAVYDAGTRTIRQKDVNYTPEMDPDETFLHDFGICPAQFIQNLPSYDTIDGDSTLACAYGLFDMINEQLSGAHQALLGNLDPTLLLKMAAEDYNRLGTMGGPVQTGTGINGQGLVVGEKGDGKYLEIQGDAIKLSIELVEKIKQFALDVTDCVIADPHRITGAAQSAAAIAKLYASMLAKCDILRTQYGSGIKRLMAKITKVFLDTQKLTVLDDMNSDRPQVKQLTLNPIESVDPETDKVITLEPELHITSKDIKLVWGDYFEATAADAFAAVEAAVMATGGKPVTSLETAIKYIAKFIPDPDPARTLVAVKADIEKTAQQELELAKAGVAAKAKKSAAPKPGAGKPAKTQSTDD